MKPTKEHIETGKELAKKHGLKQLFVNESGEFFTSQNAASLSVGHNKDKFVEVPLTAKEIAAAEKEAKEVATKEAAAKKAAEKEAAAKEAAEKEAAAKEAAAKEAAGKESDKTE
jgi:hypothetical protein